MKSFCKVIALMMFSITYVNCAPQSMNAVDGLEKVSDTGSVVATSEGDIVTMPLEASAPLSEPSNNLPAEVIDIPNDLITLLTPPMQQPTTSAGGLGGFLGNLFGFGGGGSSSGGGACGILSPILSMGASFLTGGNPIVGMLVPQLASSLLNCGSSSSLTSLIPNGSSGNQQIFALVSQIMQAHSQGKDPFALLNAIKNPQDLNAIFGIVSTLVGQTGNPQLQNLLSIIGNFQNGFGGSVGACGNMNAMACQVFQIVNQLRKDNGLQALIPSVACTLAAQTHSKDMLTNKTLTHTSSTGLSTKARMEQFGLKGAVAENIVKGAKLSAQQAVQMWMNSQSHRNNILSAAFTSGGVGFVDGYFTQCFTK